LKVSYAPRSSPLPSGPLNVSEAAVFRWVVIVGLAAASVIALALLTTPPVGALWGLVLVCAGLVHGYRWLNRHR
jgi:uncharacterized membrane protein YdcZ (DUF606 family)